MERLGNFVKPEIVIWYHQDYFRISPSSGREGAIRERYASLVQLPLLTIAGGTYSGTGTMWSKSLQGPNGISLTVEFGPSPLRPGEALWNANAVMTIVREFFQNS
jgi:protein MpaA